MHRTAVLVATILALALASVASVAHAEDQYTYIATEKVYIHCSGVG